MKYIITESQHNNAIDRFITYQLEPHEKKILDKYPKSIFWIKDGEIVAEVDWKYDYFWLKDDIWNTVSSMFSLEYDKTAKAIQYWFEEHYKLKGLEPTETHNLRIKRWNEIEL